MAGVVITDRTPAFRWHATSGATWCQIWINRNGVKNQAKWVNNSTTWTPPSDMKAGNYSWWFRAWGPAIGMHAWSAKQEFTIPANPPDRPVLLTPSGAQADRPPLFDWDSNGQAVWCHIHINKNGNSEWYQIFLNRNGSKYSNNWYRRNEVLNGAELELNYNLPVGSYNWWLRGWNAADGMGPWVGRPFTVTP